MKHEELVASVNRIYNQLYWQLPAGLVAPHPAEGVLNNPDDYSFLNSLLTEEMEEFPRTLARGSEMFKAFVNTLSTAITNRRSQIAAVYECGNDPVRKVRAQRKIKLIQVSVSRWFFHLKPDDEVTAEEFVALILSSLVDSCNGSILAMLDDFPNVKWKVRTH
jgi:hypothetical protein